jgi:hypothetical protein
MRRLLVVAVLTALLAVPAVWAARPTPAGDGTLSVRNGRGEIVLLVKGAVIGRMASGKLTLTDNDPYDEQEPDVRGRIRPRPKPINENTKVYRGKKLRFRVLEGTYRLRIEGRGIHLSAVGRGWVILDGDDRYLNTGVYSLNGDPYEPIPWERTEKLKIQLPGGEGRP